MIHDMLKLTVNPMLTLYKLIASQLSNRLKRKCAHISDGAKVTDVCMGNNIFPHTSLIVGISPLRPRHTQYKLSMLGQTVPCLVVLLLSSSLLFKNMS